MPPHYVIEANLFQHRFKMLCNQEYNFNEEPKLAQCHLRYSWDNVLLLMS